VDVVLILRLAAIDAEPSGLLSSLPEIVGLLDRLRADLLALGAVIDADRARSGAAKDGSAEIVERPGKQLHRNEQAYAELTRALERDHADALKMLAELNRKTTELGEQRQALVGRVSAPLLAQYEAAVREGRRPAVAAARDSACSACGTPLELEAWRRVLEGGQIVPCSGCMRLLHDPGWVERDFMPPTLRPVSKTPS
jgi:predicted  nucleic acid-binding Zn-ribbon protein